MLEPEVAFADLQDVMQLAEDCVRSVGESVRSRCEQEVDFFAQRVDESVVARLDAICGGGRGAGPPYARMTYTEAVRELARETERRQRSGGEPFQFPVHWGASLQTEHERWLCETLCEGRPVFVTHYPATVKPFYMRAGGDPKAEGEVVEAMDLLVPGVVRAAWASHLHPQPQPLPRMPPHHHARRVSSSAEARASTTLTCSITAWSARGCWRSCLGTWI